MNVLYNSPFFHISLCVLAYFIGLKIQKKYNQPLFNPLLIAITLLIILISITNIPYESFHTGTSLITLLLAPATVCLALPMFKQIETMKKNIVPILIGSFLGAATSIGSVLVLSPLFSLNQTLTTSLLPKSVTTPIAMSISELNGGIVAVTVAAVVLTGIVGTILIPPLLKWLKLEGSVTLGITMGTASHALGTSKAVEIGEKEGGLAGLAIGITGIFTVILSILITII